MSTTSQSIRPPVNSPTATTNAPRQPGSRPSITTTLHIRSKMGRGGNLLLDLPIAGRLTLGFLTAALIAALVVGTIGIQRSQSLSKQSDFYQTLLHTNIALTTGANFLQLMNTQTHLMLDHATAPQPSQETLILDQSAVQGLTSRYDVILTGYISKDLLTRHDDQMLLLAKADHTAQATQQSTLAGSALRTWKVYQMAQAQILKDVVTGNLSEAQHLEQSQGEPTNADALSALRALILFDQRLAASVHEAADAEEQNQLITTIIGSILAFIGIVLVGWLISGTLVRRLRQLRRVTQAVERGELDTRVTVVGRDEIADVSASINAMLEAILSLLQETRQQRDALTNAADHLFSDMRVVSAGDLSVNAVVSNDPIGMLANAFNFTVGRFRRFVLRTQTIIEQLDVISRQEMERSEVFAQALKGPKAALRDISKSSNDLRSGQLELAEKEQNDLIAHIRQTRERLQRLSDDGITRPTRSIWSLAEQISQAVKRINKVLLAEIGISTRGQLATSDLIRLQAQELRGLEALQQRIVTELQHLQHQSTQECYELDAELAHIYATANSLKLKSSQLVESTPKESAEIVRLGNEFTSEIATMAAHLAGLVREMRSGIVAFQLEAARSNLAEKMPTNKEFIV